MQYKDFIVDLSNRSKAILDELSKCKELQEYDVTALLSFSISIFIIPFERLKKDHPFSDKNKFPKIAKDVEKELNSKIQDSSLFLGKGWKFCNEIQQDDISKRNFSCIDFEEIDQGRDSREMISIIRNALAHGNIFTEPSNGKIENIFFISKKRTNSTNSYLKTYPEQIEKLCDEIRKNNELCSSYKILRCSVSDFRDLLYKWINLITSTESN